MTIDEALEIYRFSPFHMEHVVREAMRVIDEHERGWHRPENGLPETREIAA